VLSSSQFAARSILEPLSNTAIVEKFRHLTDGLVEPGRQDRLIEMVANLDHQEDCSELGLLLRPSVRSPFESEAPR
jgi:hypothetical protein